MSEYKPLHLPLDLGEIDERFAGQSLPILRNPTRKFRREFLTSMGEKYYDGIAFILGVEREKVNELLDEIEDSLVAFLFLGVWGDNKLEQLPHVYKLWDAYTSEQAKRFAMPSVPKP